VVSGVRARVSGPGGGDGAGAELLVEAEQTRAVVVDHLEAADDLLDRRLLLDLLLEEPVEQGPGVEVALGLGEAVEVADRRRHPLLVGQRRGEGVEDGADGRAGR
jgi:hypothetical protein